MTVCNLDKIFRPRNVAVIGASAREGSLGQTVLNNLTSGNFPGDVYLVNPKYTTLANRTVYASVQELPEPVDLAIICTPAPTVPQLVDECGRAGIRGLIILSAGFRERGAEGEALERAMVAAAARHDGLRIIGPNCLGIIAPHMRLNASFAAAMPAAGKVAFLSQSGALCTAVLDWAMQEKIGFSHFVSVGNMLDVGIGDLIDYLATDPWTESLILYVESINEARQFMSAARGFARRRPIIAYKAGRFAESARAAASHTGALAGVDTVYAAAFARAGIIRVFDIKEMFDCAELLARQKTPGGARLAIVTNAGGPGVMASDVLLERQGILAELSVKTCAQLDAELPPAWSHGNPVDVLGDAGPERFVRATDIVLKDDQIDAVVVVLTPQAMTLPTETAQALVDVARHSSKPILASWMGGLSVQAGVRILNDAGIPTYDSPDNAVRAFMHLVSYARRREVLYETPRDIPMRFPLDRVKLRAVFDTILAEGRDLLSESTSKALLEAYEIPVAKPYVARSSGDAVALAHRLGFPVALKVLSPQITHKTDVGGVALDLANDAEVVVAYEQIIASLRARCPDAVFEGTTVQRMFTAPSGHELIVGAKRDRVFGAVLLVGAGGIAAELFQDCALELPPLSETLARRMLESLRSWPLLRGYRGRPGVNIDRLIEILMRISYLVADYPEIAELDVNPLLVTERDVVALDARIVLDHEAILHPPRPYSHLAIRPYPEEFVRQIELEDGSRVLLRPIKPEDEPLWHELLACCSEESLWHRFRYVFKGTTHEMATRFCFIDYDRELAIVAEVEEKGVRRLVGVCRLVGDADHQNAEFAILVMDAWQGRGLGRTLTAYCLEICRKWGIQQVVAETAPNNHRMIELFRKMDFAVEHRMEEGIVLVKKTIC